MIKQVGVIGAGQMGNGIAHVLAIAGYDVVLKDVNEEQLTKAIKTIQRNLDRQVSKGKVSEADREAAINRIKCTTDYGDFKACDLVIEAATENEAVKIAILKDLFPNLKPEAIIATNTSSISVTKLASSTDRPEKFMGMHFMNPVPMMELIELIRGIATDDETFHTIRDLSEDIGKTVAVAEDFPAFIVNRILIPMINEAIYTLYEGVGTVEEVDRALRLGAHHPMGPFELADFIGLDVCLAIMQVLNEGFADTKYRPCPLLVKYVEAGWLGKKTKRGFYDYSGETPVPTR